MGEDFIPLVTCVACGGNNLHEFLDLGHQPLANSFALPAVKLQSYPLSTNVCADCFHSQLSVSINPNLIFRDYAYVSGTTTTLKAYFEWFVHWASGGQPDCLKVLDIASNDGSLLNAFSVKGHKVLGIDPAANLITASAAMGIPTICDYWPGSMPDFLKPVFDIVVAMNVVAHVPDPLVFVEAVGQSALSADGNFYIQTSQSNMVPNREFDTIYHEHISFFTVKSMSALCDRAGMRLVDVQKTPIHGESYLWTVRGTESSVSESVALMQEYEQEMGVYDLATYEQFAKDAAEIAKKVSSLSEELKAAGCTLWAYGAAAKANTFINFSQLELHGVFDDNELKQGLISPGGSIPVLAPEKLAEQPGRIAVVCTAWNFRKEIAGRIKEKRGHGNDLILTYFPSLSVMTIDEAIIE